MATSFTDWLALRSKNRHRQPLSAHTLRQKGSCLATVSKRSADLFGTTNVAQVAQKLTTRSNVERLFDSLATTHKAGSIRNIYFMLVDFSKFALAQKYISTPLALDADCDLPPKKEQASISVFTPQEVSEILIGAKTKGFRFYLFVATLLMTGRRIGEVLNIRFVDVKLTDDVPHVVIVRPKGTATNSQAQYAPLNADLRELWTQTHRLEPTRWPTSKDPQTYPFPWTYENARRRWADLLHVLDIPYRNPHQARHTFATGLIARGVPLNGVSKLMGHSTTATTERFYVHLTALAYAKYLDS